MGYRLKPCVKNTLLATGVIVLGTLATQDGKIAEKFRPHGLPQAPAVTCLKHAAEDSLHISGKPHKTPFVQFVQGTGDSFEKLSTEGFPIYKASPKEASSQVTCEAIGKELGITDVITVDQP
jgi:hypothetical protein